MTMSPDHVAERVAELIISIEKGASHAFAQHNAALALEYLKQLRDVGTINEPQYSELETAIRNAEMDWKPDRDADGFPLDEFRND